jgi:DNA primase
MNSNKLTNEDIQRLRNIRINNIIGVVDSNRNVSIRCPFHNEKTPSFILYPDNSFHCFGCNKNGQGAIDFCMELGYTFVQACGELVKYLK